MSQGQPMDMSNNGSDNFKEYEIYRETINTIFYIIYLPIAFVGNLFTVIIVSYIVRYQRTRRSIPDLCLGLLAIVDLFSVLFIHVISAFAEGKGYIYFSVGLCSYQAFCISVYFKLQFLMQIMICLDRHFALVRPLQYRRFSCFRSMKIALSVIITTTFATSALTLTMALMNNRDVERNIKLLDTWTICVFTWTMATTTDYVISGVLIVIFLVGFVTFVVCNITLVRLLWHYHRHKTTMVWREITKAVQEMHKPLYKSPNLTPKTPIQKSPVIITEPEQSEDARRCQQLITGTSNGKVNHKLLIERDCKRNEQVDMVPLENKSIHPCVNDGNVPLTEASKSPIKRGDNAIPIPDLSVNRSNTGNTYTESKSCDVVNTSDGSGNINKSIINKKGESTTGESIDIAQTRGNQCKQKELSAYDDSCFSDSNTADMPLKHTPPDTHEQNINSHPQTEQSHKCQHESTKSHQDASNNYTDHLRNEENMPLSLTNRGQTDNTEDCCDINASSHPDLSNDSRFLRSCVPNDSMVKKLSTSSICSSTSKSSAGKIQKSVSFARDVSDADCPNSPNLSTSVRVKTMRHLGEDISNTCGDSHANTSCSSEASIVNCNTNANRTRFGPVTPQTPDIIIDYASTDDQYSMGPNSPFDTPDLLHRTHQPQADSAHTKVARQTSLSPPVASQRHAMHNGTALTTSSSPTPQNVFDFSQRSIHSYKSGVEPDDALRHFQHQVKKILKKMHKTAHKQKREIFLARIVLLCATIFVISWMPYIVVIFLSMAKVEVCPILEDIAMRCIFLNAVFNPIFYGLCRRNYRKGYDYITQACCHVISCGIVHSPSDDKIFFDSRRRKRHLDATQRVKLLANASPRVPQDQTRRQSKPAMQILQQTLILRSNSLRQEIENVSPKDSIDKSSRSPQTVPQFRPSKHLQDLFQRYMEETDSSEEEFSSIDYEGLVCDDDEMYKNLKRAISIYMNMDDAEHYDQSTIDFFSEFGNVRDDITEDVFSALNTNDGFSMVTDDDIELDIDYDALIDGSSEHVQCLLSSASITPQAASDTDVRNIKQDHKLKPSIKYKLGLPTNTYLRQQSCPAKTSSKPGAEDESYL